LKTKKLEKELSEKENRINVNLEQIKELLAQKQQQNKSFYKLETEFNKLNSNLDEAKSTVQRLELDKIDFENEKKDLKNDIAENKLKITELIR
jgi:chromosome segregation ATPase